MSVVELDRVIEFYENAKKYVISKGFDWEIKIVDERHFEAQTYDDFFNTYVFVVLNAGMRNQVAVKIYRDYMESHDLNKIRHPSKCDAVGKAVIFHKKWFDTLRDLPTIDKKLEFITTLPWMGDITKYHLLRNLGLDVVKPDRHMNRLAKRFGFDTPLELCQYIQTKTNHRLGTIDLILWRYSNLVGT